MSAFANFAKGKVALGYGATDATIRLATGQTDRFPSPPFNATWWDSTDYPDPSDDPNVEIVTVSQIAGDYFSIIRGADGTSATAKNLANKSYSIAQVVTARTLQQMLEKPLSADAGIANGNLYFRHILTAKYHEIGLEYNLGIRSLTVDDTPENQIIISQIETGSLYGRACALNGELFVKDPEFGIYRIAYLENDGGAPTLFTSDEPYSSVEVTSYPDNTFSGNFAPVNGHAYMKNRTTGNYHEVFLTTELGANVIKISSETYS